MILIYSKKYFFSSKSFYTKKNFIGKQYKTFFEEDLNVNRIKYINNNYKVVLVFPKVNIERVLLKKVKAKLILFVDHPFSKNFKNYLKKYENYIKNKKIYFETYKNFRYFIPNYIKYIRRNKWDLKLNNYKSKKKFDIIYISGNSKITYFDLIFNFFIIILGFLNKYKKFLTLLEIKKSFFHNILFNLSLSNTWTKYYIFFQVVRYFKRKEIQKELEKLENVKIIYAGSNQFLPNNHYKKFNWLYNKRLIHYTKITKYIIIGDNLTFDLNERLFFIKYGCVPLIQDDFQKKEELKDFTFNNKNKLSNLIINLNNTNKKEIKKKLIKIIKLFNYRAVKNAYNYYLRQIKIK